MKVLVACEFSGTVRRAFAERGHDAWSCDLLPADDGSLNHLQCDATEVINMGWDLMICHPPCKFLSVSGMHWTTRGLRDPKLTEDALAFVRTLLDAPIERIALENPVSVISTKIRKPTQTIQPWWFGDDASKKTCLWLKGLKPLSIQDKSLVAPPRFWQVVKFADEMAECENCGEAWCASCNAHYHECVCIGPTEDECTYRTVDGILFATRLEPAPKMIWGNQTPSGQNKLGPSADRWKLRSKTYPGLAQAMASQWG